MKKILAVVILSISSCAINPTSKIYGASGGSKADGTVQMSYTEGRYEVVQVDEVTSMIRAKRRCISWGYTSAEAFDFVSRKCQSINVTLGGCNSWLITKEYQCN